jgi:hypothetical protein
MAGFPEMALSANDLEQQVLLSVGLPLAGGPLPDTLTQQMMSALQAQMPTIWQIAGMRAASVATGYQAVLQMIYARKECLWILMGQLRGRKDQMVGRVLRVSWSQVFRNVYQMYRETETELKETLTLALTSGGGMVSAPILQRAPLMPGRQLPHVPAAGEPVPPPPCGPDPNSPRYTGGFRPHYPWVPWFGP